MITGNSILSKITSKKARVGVVGIGYVGSNFSEAVGKAGYDTIGFGRNPQKVIALNARNIPNVHATIDTEILSTCDIICICVPTPLTKRKTPNLAALKSASAMISRHVQKGQLIILESSVAPGTTKTIVLPILERSGLAAGVDFFLGYSPERVDPGNLAYPAHKIPKIIAGLDTKALSLMKEFYTRVVSGVTQVSTLETAELTKVFENVFRFVNISLVNELSHLTEKLGISTHEVINAASTKPFGFLAHYPSPGIGGDCIPVMPRYYLSATRKAGVHAHILRAAIKTDNRQPLRVVHKAKQILTGRKSVGKPCVLLVGVSYKKDVGDVRESASLAIWKLLADSDIDVYYHDPHVSHINGSASQPISKSFIRTIDLIIITTDHSEVSYDSLVNSGVPILDTRHALHKLRAPQIYTFG